MKTINCTADKNYLSTKCERYEDKKRGDILFNVLINFYKPLSTFFVGVCFVLPEVPFLILFLFQTAAY